MEEEEKERTDNDAIPTKENTQKDQSFNIFEKDNLRHTEEERLAYTQPKKKGFFEGSEDLDLEEMERIERIMRSQKK